MKCTSVFFKCRRFLLVCGDGKRHLEVNEKEERHISVLVSHPEDDSETPKAFVGIQWATWKRKSDGKHQENVFVDVMASINLMII